MATYIRKNSWNNGGNFNNSDLLWYAKGVGKMMSRAISDPASWWFYAAIHGEYVNPANAWYVTPPAFPDWQFITPPPAVSISPLPSQATQDLYWNQCQHGSWYFPPWHRGYLLSLEAQLRQDIVSLGGPATWALPYWNYFGGQDGDQYQMPPAFAATTLPDGSANPLFVVNRYGPDGDDNIYVPTPAGEAAHPGDPNYSYGGVTDTCLNNDLYTGADAKTRPPGFGGPQSGFAHSGSPHGNLESNPHDLVHVYVGSAPDPSSPIYGLMADPGIAALDPIFYLHHANIDRMWAVWNASGHANPTDKKWLDGPSTRRFAMPGPGTAPWYYTPDQVDSLGKLDYTYEDLAAQPAPLTTALAQRLAFLGAPSPSPVAAPQALAAPQASTTQAQLLGANAAPLRIQGRVSHTSIKLDPGENANLIRSFAAPSVAAVPDRVYLKLENVRGTTDASVLGVYLNLPENARPGDNRKLLAGHVALFGLRRASVKDGEHGGEGLTFLLDVTRIIDGLHLSNTLDAISALVSIVPSRALPDKADITVGRISLYRQPN